MFTSKQYRAKATEYGDLAETSAGSNQRRDFQKLERRFAALAHNEQLLADNYQSNVSSVEQGRSNGVTLADEEEHVLRCLGAALIMQWNALPQSCKESSSTTPGAWVSSWRRRPSEDKSLAFCTGIRMTTTQRRRSEQKLLTAMRGYTPLLWRGGMMREALAKCPNNEGWRSV
jgi:hypothetical protein